MYIQKTIYNKKKNTHIHHGKKKKDTSWYLAMEGEWRIDVRVTSQIGKRYEFAVIVW